MLPALHTQGRLVKIPTSQVEMMPTNSTSIILSELNQIIADQRGIAVDELSIQPGTSQEKANELAKVKELADKDYAKTTSEIVNTPEVPAVDLSDPTVAAKYYRSRYRKLSGYCLRNRKKCQNPRLKLFFMTHICSVKRTLNSARRSDP